MNRYVAFLKNLDQKSLKIILFAVIDYFARAYAVLLVNHSFNAVYFQNLNL